MPTFVGFAGWPCWMVRIERSAECVPKFTLGMKRGFCIGIVIGFEFPILSDVLVRFQPCIEIGIRAAYTLDHERLILHVAERIDTRRHFGHRGVNRLYGQGERP